jgi:hypothetical protein
MRIGYVAKHGSGGNQDEDAITFALEHLGHEVTRLREVKGNKAYQLQCDFLLFHHWNDPESLQKVRVPTCFWNFDLVTYPDPTLNERNQRRVQWMNVMTPLVNVGFCTDGDWVNQDTTGKLVRLCQGMDERVMGRGELKYPHLPPILFTGTHRGGGAGREGFVKHLNERWDKQFMQVKGVHGRELADFIASSQVCVAPDHPATDNYWSNRVYLTAGFGGCLLHPYCQQLETQYEYGVEIMGYSSLSSFDLTLKQMLQDPDELKEMGQNAYERTVKEHLYRHRVETLVQIMKERCF